MIRCDVRILGYCKISRADIRADLRESVLRKYKMLIQLWLDVRPASRTVGQHQTIIIGRTSRVPDALTRHIDPMLDQCWANVVDGGPTLVQLWIDVLCLLGRD